MTKKALVISALSLGTGSGLRAKYLHDALARLGHESRLAAPGGGPRPYSAEFVTSAPRCLAAAWPRVDFAVGVKPYPNVWLALALAHLRGAITIVDVDDGDSGYRGGALGALTKVLQAPAFHIADYFSTHHPLLRQALVDRVGEAKVLDLPQGVDTRVFDPQRHRARVKHWRQEQGLLDGPLLGFAAHLNIACQLDVLLNAVGPWLKRRPAAVLVVAGGGPDQARFQALAAPLGRQIRFLGSLSPDAVALALCACDVGLSAYGDAPGNQYRVPMKVAEYLALGLPVVTNMIPGLKPLRPYVQEAEIDPATFGRALNQALSAAGKVKAKKGQAYVWRMLAWDRVAKDFLAQLKVREEAAGRPW
jgi:glycosyltransferase involved in cell wall biosynthesis